MRLWTWQKRGFSPADRDSQVESLNNSIYVNDSREEYACLFKRTYKKLWEKLGTCQFHWYYTEEDEAKDCEDYEHDLILWEVDVPDEAVFRRVCSISWNRLLNRRLIPRRLEDYWQSKAPASQLRKTNAERAQAFHEFWESKTEDELWELLFLSTYVEGCTQILLRHPLGESWIVRNPENEGTWWTTPRGNRYAPGPYVNPLPCRNCLGRV